MQFFYLLFFKLVRNNSKFHNRDPGIGVGIFLADTYANRILLGKRKDSGLYGLPGGWLEKFEDWDECASRELKEEVNLDFKKNRFFNVKTFNCMNLDKNYHAISLILYSEIQEDEKKNIKNMEPNKCEKWFWVTINQLRGQLNLLFHPLKDFLKKHPTIDSVDYIRKLAKVPLNYLTLSSNSNSQKSEK